MRYILIFLLLCSWASFAQNKLHGNQNSSQEDSGLSAQFHKNNRQALRDLMPLNSVAVFFSSEQKRQSNDIFFTYHPDPNFYYLTGHREANSVLIIFKEEQDLDSIKTNEILFTQENIQKEEIWDGKRLGIEGCKTNLDFEIVYPNHLFASFGLRYANFDDVMISLPDEPTLDNKRDKGDLHSMVKHFRMELESKKIEPKKFALKELTARLRQIKTSEEITLIKQACQITAEAHNELMRTFEPGMTEYQAQAIVEYAFAINGAEKRAFPSICGSGNNGCTLHYSSNRSAANNGELMLVDIGAEYHGYAADVTRTFPVNGRFSKEQKTLYNLVLRAQKAGIALCKPGQKFSAPHDKSVQVLAAGLKSLGIIIETREVYDYYMHGTSHYMGLDVHDEGLYGEFKENQVVTVEPGVYIPEGSACDKKWWGIGIRIEDDILITKYGNEVMTKDTPVEISEIEALMKKGSTLFKTK